MTMEDAYNEVQLAVKTGNDWYISKETMQLCLEALRIVIESEKKNETKHM